MSDGYAKSNLMDVEDVAAKAGFGEAGAARFANEDLATQQTGISLHSLHPDQRQAFGHRHEEAEEVYVVISGSGEVKLDDQVVELAERDAVRIDPGVMRCLKAGPDGLEVLAFGPRRTDDRGEIEMGWWKD